MGLFDRLDRLVGYRPEPRAVTPQDFARGTDLDDWFASASGENVDTDAVLGIMHAWACVSLLVNDIRKLPWDVYQDLGEARKRPIPKPAWMVRPDPLDPNTTFSDHVAQVVMSILVDGNAFPYAWPSVFNVERLVLLDPTKVDVKQGRYIVRARGYEGTFDALNIRHIRNLVKPGEYRGMNPIQAAREGFGLTLAAEQFGQRFFANGAVMSGLVEVPREAGKLSDEETSRIREQFRKRHDAKRKAHAIGVLTGGATFRQLSFSPEDTQFIALRKYQLEDTARLFHIPPFKIGSTEPGAVAYASTSNARIDYVQSAIEPIVHLLEEAYSDLVPGDDTYAKANLNALLRGDPKARFEGYGVGLQNRFFKVDEVRAWEDMAPFGEADGGGFVDTPNNTMVNARITEAVALINAGADPAATLAALGLPPIEWSGPATPAPAPEVNV